MIRIYKHHGHSIEITLQRMNSNTIEYTAEIWDKDNDLIAADVDVTMYTDMTLTDVAQRVKSNAIAILRDIKERG